MTVPLITKPIISLRDVLSLEEDQGDWLVGPNLMLRGGAVALAAKTGVGKSWVASHIAQCLITGKPLFGSVYRKNNEKRGQPIFPVKQVERVLYIDYETALRRQRRKPFTTHWHFPG